MRYGFCLGLLNSNIFRKFVPLIISNRAMRRAVKAILIFQIVALSLFFISSCQRSYRSADIDISGINLTVRLERFDRDLFALNSDSLQQGYNGLRDVYGDFIDLFAAHIIRIGAPQSPLFERWLGVFRADTMIADVKHQVDSVFANTDAIDRELTDAFKRAAVYFPTSPTPRVFALISGFNVSMGVDSAALYVGLDRYLGSECPYYSMLGIPRYMQAKMSPENIAPDAVRAWLVGEFPFNDSIENFAARMMWEGAVMYAAKHLLPQCAESRLFGFSDEQMRFCRSNEDRMWTTLVEQKLLFTTNNLEINKYLGEAPFTSGFTQESPGRATVWIASRIVESYMRHKPQTTLAELMMQTDYVALLNASKYRP